MLKNKWIKIVPLTILGLAITTSCSKASSSDSSGGSIASTPEISFCNNTQTYATYATITGTAQFSKRGLSVDAATSGSDYPHLLLSTPISAPLPIKYAEIQVVNSNGTTVQCGTTDATGAIRALDGASQLRIPATAGTYTVNVYARSQFPMPVSGGKAVFNSNFSVKEDIYSNTLYKISESVNVTGANSYSIAPVATALESTSSKIEGGAFNIYNDIISSLEYLGANTGSQSLSCLDTKLSVYWKAGFNPNQYVYPNNDPSSLGTISFYLRSYQEMYINGGIQGNVSSVDTDHFDDAVIIHELGHHIENVCGKMDSPGGSHSGQTRIDPRLAWSEGWGNFLAAHVIKNKMSTLNPDLSALLPNTEWVYYLDTGGHTTNAFEYIRIKLSRQGKTSTSEKIKLSSGSIGTTNSYDQVNPSAYPGESHTREVSISRALFKSTNSCSGGYCVGANNFSSMWNAINKTTGIGQANLPFRSSARFVEKYKTALGASYNASMVTLFTNDEAWQPYGHSSYDSGGALIWVPYGVKLVPSPGNVACPLKIQPRANSLFAGGNSDQRSSNHFYAIDKTALPGVTTININSAWEVGTSGLNIGLVMHNEGYSFSQTYSGTTSINLDNYSNLNNYLLNVRVNTPGSVANPTTYSYTLTDQNGSYLCPSSSF